MKISNTTASRFLLALIILMIASGLVFAVINLRSNPVDDALSANRVINVLFVIEDDKKPLSSYVLMYYPETNRAAIFDIPGELGLLITRINRVDRIDKVYDPAKIASYISEIDKLLGIDITFYIVISTENLVSIVDILEGVELFIPSPVSYKSENKLILFPSGLTVLDGDKARDYASYSLPNEDREIQIYRRQRFFMGLLNRLINMNDNLKEPVVSKIFYSCFRTSMNSNTLIRLFSALSRVDTDRTNIQSVSGNLREVSGQMLIIPHWDGNLVKEVVRQTLGTLTRQVSDYNEEGTLTVEVLNGTMNSGLASRTAEMLKNFGYDVISVGNAEHNNYDSTVIIHRSADENAVKSFAEVIKCNNIRNELALPDKISDNEIQNFEYKADITLIIGKNFNGRYVTEDN